MRGGLSQPPSRTPRGRLTLRVSRQIPEITHFTVVRTSAHSHHILLIYLFFLNFPPFGRWMSRTLVDYVRMCAGPRTGVPLHSVTLRCGVPVRLSPFSPS